MDSIDYKQYFLTEAPIQTKHPSAEDSIKKNLIGINQYYYDKRDVQDRAGKRYVRPGAVPKYMRDEKGKLVPFNPKKHGMPKMPANPKAPVANAPEKTFPKQKLSHVTGGGDADVKQFVVSNGFGVGISAPGNPGSAFNEIVTGEGIHMISAEASLENADNLAKAIYKKFYQTKLGQQNFSGEVYKSPSDPRTGLDKGFYEKCLSTAKCAIGEHKRIQNTLNNLKWPADSTFNHYYGSTESKKKMIEELSTAKRIVSPDGQMLSREEAMHLVQKSGGGENPSDTAIFIKNSKNGSDVCVMFTSNKLTPADIQANSSLQAEFSELETLLSETKMDPNQLSAAQKKIKDTAELIAKIENGAKGDVSNVMGNYFLDKDDDKLYNALIRNMSSTDPKDPKKAVRFHSFVVDKYTLSNVQKIDSKGNPTKTAQAIKSNLEAIGWKKGEPSAKQKLKAFLYHVANEAPSADELKLLYRSAVGEAAVHDVKSILNDSKKKLVDAQFDLIKKLNQHKTADGVHLGRHLEALNLMKKMHLEAAFDNSKSPIFSHKGLFALNMGGVMVDGNNLKECLGVSNSSEYRKGFSASKANYQLDKEGNISGGTSIIYRLNNKGEEVPFATRTIRSKGGKTGMMATVYFWHPEAQKCFKQNNS